MLQIYDMVEIYASHFDTQQAHFKIANYKFIKSKKCASL
jgi:hypothetical protein